MEKIFKTTPTDLLVSLISTVFIYVLVIFYIRVLGKRSTSQLNNFDWIVTVSIGSILSSTILLPDVSVTEGGSGVLFLLLLQYVVTKMMYNSDGTRKAVKSSPTLLFLEGEFLKHNLRKERILEPEVYASIRQHGFKEIDKIYAVVLETNSKLSVIPKDGTNTVGSSLVGVTGLPDEIQKQLDVHSNKYS